MRDFRIWDKKDKKMRRVSTIYFEVGEVITEKTDFNLAKTIRFKNDELMQYTGLKDKSGKEIWEGDIVKYFSPNEKAHLEEVIFYNGIFGLPNPGAIIMRAYPLCNLGKIEVMGNKFENPELLEKINVSQIQKE